MTIPFRWRAARRHAVLLCTCALLSACADTVGTAGAAESVPDAGDPLVQRLVAMGFRLADIQDRGDYFQVEGDILFHKAQMQRTAGPRLGIAPGGGPNHQYVTDVTVLPAVMAQGLRISLSGISSHSAWTTAVRQAMQQWNWTHGNKIYFTEVTSSPDIVVSFNSQLSSSYVAVANYPINGYPGYHVMINPAHNGISASKKLNAMAHELGHTIGYRHSNYPVSDPAPGGANYIPGTPTSDGNSVMYAANRSWSGFSSGDYTAARYVYPAPEPVISSQGYGGSGAFTMSWNAVPQAAQYRIGYEYWYEEFVYDPTFPESGYYAWMQSEYHVTTTSSTTFSDAGQGTGSNPYSCAYTVSAIYPSGKEGPRTRSQDVTC